MPSMPAPTPPPSPSLVVRCTVVATIQSPCVSQSVNAAQTRSTEASTSTDATSSATAVLPLRSWSGCAGIGHWRDRLGGGAPNIEDAGGGAGRFVRARLGWRCRRWLWLWLWLWLCLWLWPRWLIHARVVFVRVLGGGVLRV